MISPDRKRRTLARAVVALSILLLIGWGGVAARNLWLEGARRADALVIEGRRDFARNDRAAAIVAFERARWFAPRSRIVRAELATLGVRDTEPLASRLLGVASAPEWAAIATASGWIAALGLALFLVRRKRDVVIKAAAAAGATFAAAMIALVAADARPTAIVTSADAELRVAPYSTAASTSALPSGTVVVVGTRYADFVHIQTSDGADGWTTASKLESIAAATD